MAEYVFKMKKGEVEIELSSDDAEFVEQQLAKWREEILKKQGQFQMSIYRLKVKCNNAQVEVLAKNGTIL